MLQTEFEMGVIPSSRCEELDLDHDVLKHSQVQCARAIKARATANVCSEYR
jgi:hypothetical protein